MKFLIQCLLSQKNVCFASPLTHLTPSMGAQQGKQQVSGLGIRNPTTQELEMYFLLCLVKTEWLQRQMAPKQPREGMAVLKSCGTKGKKSWLELLWRGEKKCLKYKINSWLEKAVFFPLLLESLCNTATWWLPSIALPGFCMQCDLSSHCTVKIL